MTSLFPLAAPYAVTSPSGRGAFSFRRARTLSPIAPGPLSGAATSAVARLTRSLPTRMAMDGSPIAVRLPRLLRAWMRRQMKRAEHGEPRPCREHLASRDRPGGESPPETANATGLTAGETALVLTFCGKGRVSSLCTGRIPRPPEGLCTISKGGTPRTATNFSAQRFAAQRVAPRRNAPQRNATQRKP